MAGAATYGLLAQFDDPERLLAAAATVRDAGYRRFDAYTPFPIHGLAEAVGFRERRIPWLCLAGGLTGAVLAYAMQVYVNLDYSIDIGGRAVIATPAFLVVTFELTILFAALFAVGGMLVLNRLPRLSHPLFDVEAFHLASVDRFFLCIETGDARFDERDTEAFLASLGPVSVTRVPA